MKKLIALTIALVMLPSIALAVTYYPYHRKNIEFEYKYYSASKHEDTTLVLSNWQKTNVLGEYTHHIKKGVSIRVKEDTISADVIAIGVGYNFNKGKPFTEQSDYEGLFLPALYRVLRMFDDVQSADVKTIISKLHIDSMKEHGKADIAGPGTFHTSISYENLLVDATLHPKQGSIVIYVAYQ
jgi:hypothetical protein